MDGFIVTCPLRDLILGAGLLVVALLALACWVYDRVSACLERRRQRWLERHCAKCTARMMARQAFRHGDVDLM